MALPEPCPALGGLATPSDTIRHPPAEDRETIQSLSAKTNAMRVTLRVPTMTREQFFDWAEAQGARYEFDRFQPVAMTGRNLNHNQIAFNIHVALRGAPGRNRVPVARPGRGRRDGR